MQWQKISLFVDNFPRHSLVMLSNVAHKIFPKNMFSRIQPLDQGITDLFEKGLYEVHNGDITMAMKLQKYYRLCKERDNFWCYVEYESGLGHYVHRWPPASALDSMFSDIVLYEHGHKYIYIYTVSAWVHHRYIPHCNKQSSNNALHH